MNAEFLAEPRICYPKWLFEDVVPFWLRHGRDHQYGGYVTCLGRDGTPYEWNKLCMWNSGRMIWMFSHLYNEVDRNPAWLDMARCGVEFALRHGFAPDGRMFYSLTREGRPLEPPNDVFTELFHAAGFSEYARATGDRNLGERAWGMFCGIWQRMLDPNKIPQPLVGATMPVRRFGHALIALNVLDELRCFVPRPEIDAMVDQCLAWIFRVHTKPEQQACFEMVGWDGAPAPGHWGRWVTPGHMIEAGIFTIHEARLRGDGELARGGVDLIDWGFQRGWDRDFGGIFNDVDVESRPFPDRQAYLANAKLWWQHAEALYGLLLAYVLTEEDRFLDAFRQVHGYVVEHFVDSEHGEWFALLDRRGNRLHDIKGNSRKSIFHVGRNLFYICRLLDDPDMFRKLKLPDQEGRK